tara:strand:+ start:1891 stop:2172 length:282 start_codon:yes stop_codon:yes gene_type:complete
MWNKKDFLSQKAAVIKYFKKKGVSQSTISEYCTMVGIPIIVVCGFIMEEMPEHSKLCKDKIRSIKKFYGIKEETCGTCDVFCGEDHCITRRGE